MQQDRSDGGRLRVDVVVAGAVVPSWVVGLLDDVLSSPDLDLGSVVVAAPTAGGARSSSRGSPVERALSAGDRALFGRRVTLLRAADVRVWADSRDVRLESAGTPSAGGVVGDGALPRSPGVVLDLSGSGEVGDIGIDGQTWSLVGVPLCVDAADMGLLETAAGVIGGSQVTAFELWAGRSGRRGRRLLHRAVCPAHPTSPALTHEYLAASARQLIIEGLRAAGAGRGPGATKGAEVGDPAEVRVAPASRPDASASVASGESRRPGPLTVAAFLARTAGRQARRALYEKQWHLLVGTAGADQPLPDPSRLRPLLPGPGRYWADPFVVTLDGRTHVFFEEFVYESRKGRIGVVTLDPEGRPGSERVALQLDGHLSYPCVFTHDGRLFMVPESAGASTVDLYECVDMPAGWAHRRTLLSGFRLVDASVFRWHDLWWMFASLKKPPGLRTAELLVLYMCEDPVTGAWRPHPASPLLADVTNARPAGAPFAIGDRLFRPAQDGAGDYGRAITLNEVLALTPDSYAERRLGTLQPDWARGLAGTHTMNRADGVVVMDACRFVLRDPRRPRAESMME